MNTKQLQFVTFEQAQALKELGFDWDTSEFYHSDGTADIYYCTNHNANGETSAPAVALALKWCRDAKGIVSGINPMVIPTRYAGAYYCDPLWRSIEIADSYEAAESALLSEIIKYLKTK